LQKSGAIGLHQTKANSQVAQRQVFDATIGCGGVVIIRRIAISLYVWLKSAR
jgi:hypothetical protein